jgi:Ca-activated chloride channel family protein
VPANNKNINRAIRFIEQTRGGGGTELLSAMKHSFSIPKKENFSRSMLVITDGYIGAEKDVFKLISKNLNDTNVFSFGIGSSVNRYLIEGIAKSGLGDPFVVTTPHEAKGTAEKFKEYVNSPVLTDISVKFGDFNTYDVEPSTIPDLFAQRPVIVFGKWRGAEKGFIEVKGLTGKGQYSKIFQIAENRGNDSIDALKYLWARKRISRLSDFNTGKDSQEIKAEITNLGLTYNLLTKYTSFIAVHDVVRNTEGPAKDVKQPLPMPKGVSNLAVGGKVPEPEFYISILILTAILVTGHIRKKRIEVALKKGSNHSKKPEGMNADFL